ncbi:MAG: hypothetical protein IRY99_00795 [Isosphaeraceae bacterium]|nr:hypothetical protein [Isosphaeraceae bacterium]
MTSDNRSCCATDPAANPAKGSAPQIGGHRAGLVEFGESLTAPSAGRPPHHRITWGSFTRVMLGVTTGMIVLVASFPYWSGPILGGVKTDSCCAPPNGAAVSTNQAATGADPCCAPPAAAGAIDPTHNVIFEVQGLECPAVRGLGCGHLLAPELAALDKLEGAERSFANRTGTMIRVTVAAAADREKVAEGVRRILTGEDRKAVPLAGIELKRALEREEWRGKDRIGELSAIEFRTLALHRVKSFATAEKLGQKATDKLMTIAEQQWERISKEAGNDGATQPEEWANRCRKSLPVLLERVKNVLTAEQVERFKQTLTGQCRDEDRPEAPPAGTAETDTKG